MAQNFNFPIIGARVIYIQKIYESITLEKVSGMIQTILEMLLNRL